MAGANVGPILAAAARKHNVPLILLIACAKAESDLKPTAFRNGPWPDVSAGPFQQTVAFAAGFGIGNGQNTTENIQLCQARLSDWQTASDVAAQHLTGCLKQARAFDPTATGDRRCLIALSVYNSGSPKDEGTDWWKGIQRHRYTDALLTAHQNLG